MPTWISSVPKTFGEASAGTLKADEWRSFCTIYLPIALICEWGEGTVHKKVAQGIRFRQALDHAMLLVSAVTVVCRRVTSIEHALVYRQLLAAYLRDLTTVHAHAHGLPNIHAALHIYDFLLLFGPVYSWWCFPFERLVGVLQRIPNNHKLGRPLVPMIW
jgi:hypothetical protein